MTAQLVATAKDCFVRFIAGETTSQPPLPHGRRCLVLGARAISKVWARSRIAALLQQRPSSLVLRVARVHSPRVVGDARVKGSVYRTRNHCAIATHHSATGSMDHAISAEVPMPPAPHPVKRCIRKKCPHGKQRYQCAAGGGGGVCKHGKRRG